MLVIPNQYKFKPSNNIKYLERVLETPIMDVIQKDIDTYLSFLSKGIIYQNRIQHNFTLSTKESQKNFSVISTFDKKQKKLMYIKNGLPYIENELMIGRMKYFKNKINFPEVMMTIFSFSNLSQLSHDLNDKILKLVNEDLKSLGGIQELRNLLSDNRKSLSRSKLKHVSILRSVSRINIVIEKKSLQPDSTGLENYAGINLLNLIDYEIKKYLDAINKSIKFWFYITVKRLFMPRYLSSLKEIEPRLKLAGKMLLDEPHLNYLLKVPKTIYASFGEVYRKYQLGLYLISEYKKLKAFDVNNLIKSNAHPKNIKDLIVNFYISNSEFKITEKIITKILRYNRRLFSLCSETLNEAACYGFKSPEVFLMVIFSDMPQISLLSSPRANRQEICNYAKAFFDTYIFLCKFNTLVDAVEITKSILRKNLHLNKNYLDVLYNVECEVDRLFHVFDDAKLIKNILSQVKSWSIRKLVALHDSITNIIDMFYQDLENARTNPELLKHIELKIIEPIIIKGFKFTQLTTQHELRVEGRIMKHCVGSYYRSNYYQNYFIFNVTPVDVKYSDNIINFSTLAVYFENDRLHIDQNYTHYNDTPSDENISVVEIFVDYINKNHLEAFTKYIKYSKQVKKLDVKKQVVGLNESFYINQLICGA